MTCEEVNARLLDFIEGELTPPETAAIRAHLAGCPACASKYRETGQLIGDLSAARSVENGRWDLDARSTPAQPGPASPVPSRIGDFEILEEIGRGGMGVVYRARQTSLNRVVALKVLTGGLVQSERAVARFHKEAQAAARLHHTNIVPIYAQGHEQGQFYYAMELIDGQSLDKVLQDDPLFLRLRDASASSERESPTRVLPPAADGITPPADGESPRAAKERVGEKSASRIRSSISSILHRGAPRTERHTSDYKRIARLVAEVAEALHHAHEQGVVHRDIKPQNLLLGRDDKLHITDFGLARLLDEPGMTLSAELVGTPAYMSPEQVSGGGKGIGPHTDVYALGVTLYETLALTRPFQGETYDQIIMQVLKRDPKPPRRIDAHIPVDLETICLRAVEKEPRRRFPSSAEMAGDLRRYAEDFPIASRRVGPVGKTVRWVRRHPARAGAIAAVAAIVVLVPLLLSTARAYANKCLSNAWEVLMADYREKDQALAELGWTGRVFGEWYRRHMVEALAHIPRDPEVTRRLAERIVERHPGDPDARYLLAWSYQWRLGQAGDEMWAKVREHIALADRLDTEPSAAGYFFRAQAVWGTDPKEAERTFDKAIKERPNFVQAMLHQARAMNQIMYFLRDPGYYQKAVSRLEFVCAAQPTKAYPRYLLSITHMLAAEIYAKQGQTEDSQDAYALSENVAFQAQEAERTSPRGYGAEANYWESRGEFRRALDAWDRMGECAERMSAFDHSERNVYRMRLCFWLDDYEEAKRSRAARYSALAGYDRDAHYVPDESLYEALIAASAGDLAAAEQALATGAERVGTHAESLVLLDAAYRLIGRTPPVGMWPGELDFTTRLPPGWTRQWLEALVGYQRGELRWEALKAVADKQAESSEKHRLMMAGAHFYRGLQELSAGQRDKAIAALTDAWQQYDNENYCFRAKLILSKLRQDPAWPRWRTDSGDGTR